MVVRGAAIVMEEYDGFSNVNTYKLDRIPVWTRIQGVPEGLMKKKELAEKVASKVGQLITVAINDGKINATSYLRARVWLYFDKPLVRVVPIMLKERVMHLVQYEKLPGFCSFCGMMGHDVIECGDGVHSKSIVNGVTGYAFPSCPWREETILEEEEVVAEGEEEGDLVNMMSGWMMLRTWKPLLGKMMR
jgi:hypothetical protein